MTAPFDPAYGDVVEAPTVSPDFTVADVLAWARTKPARRVYSYTGVEDCNGFCALDYFLIETGRSAKPNVLPWSWTDSAGESRPLPVGADEAVATRPRTFGALAERLETIAYRGRVG
jgi:hypothetical protein